MPVEILDRPRSSSLDVKIQYDVFRALELKEKYYAVLGIPVEEQPKGPLSFEPWLERAKFERIEKQFIDQFRQEVDAQLVTNLRERYRTETSTTAYLLNGNRLRSALLPNEDLEDVLLRGLEYRRQTGSNELAREEKEIEGFKQIQGIIYNPQTEIGTRIISLSPPGLTENTPYTQKMVDIWEVKQDGKGERYAEVTRFTAALDYEGYKQSALRLNPYYFADEETETLPLDAYFLSHPIPLPAVDQIGTLEAFYEAFFEPDYRAMKEELFQEVLKASRSVRVYFIDELCKDRVDWAIVAKTFNAYINVGDNFLEVRTRDKEIPTQLNYDHRYRDNMNELVDYWGMQQVMTIAAGCGLSAGFKLRYGGRLTSRGQFNPGLGSGLVEQDQYGSLEFECPQCKAINRRPYNQMISNCQHCRADTNC